MSFYVYMKDLGHLRYFLKINVARSPKGLSLSQRKYFTDLLEETNTLRSMDPNIHFNQNLRQSLANPRKYKQLIDKLIYLIVTRFDITFVASVLG